MEVACDGANGEGSSPGAVVPSSTPESKDGRNLPALAPAQSDALYTGQIDAEEDINVTHADTASRSTMNVEVFENDSRDVDRPLRDRLGDDEGVEWCDGGRRPSRRINDNNTNTKMGVIGSGEAIIVESSPRAGSRSGTTINDESISRGSADCPHLASSRRRTDEASAVNMRANVVEKKMDPAMTMPAATDGTASGDPHAAAVPPVLVTENDSGPTKKIIVECRGGAEGADGQAAARLLQELEKERVSAARAREQSKRLALEVARLRCKLNRTAAELEGERAARLLMKEKIQPTTSAADHAAQEATRRKTERGLEHVVEVQDRLVRALQAELDIAKRAQAAVQADMRETKEQLRRSVADSAFWRDRAKLLETKIDEVGQPAMSMQARRDELSESRHEEAGVVPKPVDRVEHDGKDGAEADSQKSSAGRSCGDGEVAELSSSSVEGNKDGDQGSIIVPQVTDHARLHPTVSRQSAPSPDRASVAQGQSTAGLDPTSSGMGGEILHCIGDVASSMYFARCMRAQQETSARLERELTKARAELDSFFAHKGSKVGDFPLATPVVEEDEGKLTAEDGFAEEEGGHNGRVRGIDDREGTAGNFIDRDSMVDDRGSGDVGLSQLSSFPATKTIVTGDTDRDVSLGIDGVVSGDAPRTAVATGPHMARVLAALLGTGQAEGAGRTLSRINRTRNDVPPLGARGAGTNKASSVATAGEGDTIAAAPRLLSDFPPSIQAIFDGGDEKSSSENHVTSPSRANPVATRRKSGDVEGSNNTRAQVALHHRTPINPDIGDGAFSIGCDRVEIEGRNTSVEGKAAEATMAGPAHAAFRGYEAKSPFLRRWMAERA